MNQINKPTFIESSKDLLLKILKSSQLTKAQCGLYLGKHKHSLDSYLYKFSNYNIISLWYILDFRL